MQVLNDQFNLSDFLEAVSRAETPVLLLDYDGTLAPFKDRPGDAVPYDGVKDILQGIRNNQRTRLVVISGRSIDDLLPLLAMDPSPEIWGSHGLEHLRPDGSRRQRELPEQTVKGFERIVRFVHENDLQEATEYKPSGAAFHWRGVSADRVAAIRRIVIDAWYNAVDDYGLELHEFDGGIELRAAGITKGDAVASILSTTPGDQPVAFFGDDRTDEDGFRALSGRGMSVLVRPEFRETTADVWLQPPEELLEILRHWE